MSPAFLASVVAVLVGQTTTEPVAQDAVGTGELRFWLLAVALFVLALMIAALTVLYWRATSGRPPAR